MKPDLLRAFGKVKEEIKISGVGGVQLSTNTTGYLEDFFRVFVSSETKANVLSFAEVEDMYEITYVPCTSFVVHLPGRDIEFIRKGKLYVADFSDHYHYQANLTKQEFVKQAYELIRNIGFVSVQEAIRLLEEGNIANMPRLVAADFHRALVLYSPPVEYVRGKTTRKKVSRAVIDDNLFLDRKQQVLYMDVMHIDKQRFLVSVCEPLQLTDQCQIERKSQEVLGTALQGHFEVLRSRGFIPVRVHADPQSAFHSLTTAYPGVTVDIGGAGDYVAKIVHKIRSIKELYHCVKARKLFHSTVAKLLYLAKRVRPDIIIIVGFLCTRVKAPLEDDQSKLETLLGYLNKTKHQRIIIKPHGMFKMQAYVDASFGIHVDGKSHTGCVIMVAGVPVFCSSRKQKCMTKSPTKAELVGLSDNLANIEVFAELMEFITGEKAITPVIYQDNTSVISLVTQGGGMMRTKHLRARVNLVLEAVAEKRVKVVYVSTEKMIADGLTKVLGSSLFYKFAKHVLGKG
jgi:hypothetical protein